MIVYLKATRPQTLIASLAPVFSAFVLAQSSQEIINKGLLLNCVLIGIFIQIAVNIFNDLIDGKNGVDDIRVGDARMSSLANKNVLWSLGFVSLLICFISSLALFEISLLYIPLALSSLFFAYGYTGGPFPLAYNGLGEIFVYIYFGLVAFIGTFYALTGALSLLMFVSGSLFGMLSILIIYANNYRDLEGDKKFGKRTIAVKYEKSSKLIFLAFILSTTMHKLIFTFCTSRYLFLISLFTDILLVIFIYKNLNRQKIFKVALLNLLTTTLLYIAVI